MRDGLGAMMWPNGQKYDGGWKVRREITRQAGRQTGRQEGRQADQDQIMDIRFFVTH